MHTAHPASRRRGRRGGRAGREGGGPTHAQLRRAETSTWTRTSEQAGRRTPSPAAAAPRAVLCCTALEHCCMCGVWLLRRSSVARQQLQLRAPLFNPPCCSSCCARKGVALLRCVCCRTACRCSVRRARRACSSRVLVVCARSVRVVLPRTAAAPLARFPQRRALPF